MGAAVVGAAVVGAAVVGAVVVGAAVVGGAAVVHSPQVFLHFIAVALLLHLPFFFHQLHFHFGSVSSQAVDVVIGFLGPFGPFGPFPPFCGSDKATPKRAKRSNNFKFIAYVCPSWNVKQK